jgi:hypothetical protein
MHLNAAETSGSSPPGSPPSLSDLETKIGTGIRRIKSAWVEVGLALGEIRDRRLYSPLTFDGYLANHPDWGITRRHADRIIKSARIADAVNQTKWADWMPDVPNEAVARALANLPEEKAAEVYAAACTNANGEEPKAKDMQEAITKLFGGDDANSDLDDDEAAIYDVEAEGDEDAETNCDADQDGSDEGGDCESDSGSDDDHEHDEANEDFVHDYVVTISCKPVDSEAVAAAVAGYLPKINPLNTKFSFPAMWTDDLARLFVSLANIVDNLTTNIDLRVKAGAE